MSHLAQLGGSLTLPSAPYPPVPETCWGHSPALLPAVEFCRYCPLRYKCSTFSSWARVSSTPQVSSPAGCSVAMRGAVGSYSSPRQTARCLSLSPSGAWAQTTQGLGRGGEGGLPQNSTLVNDGFWTMHCPGAFLTPHLLGAGWGDGKQTVLRELTCGVDNAVQERP